MKFYSTNNPQSRYTYKEAIFQGLPSDNGLFMPEFIPKLDEIDLKSLIGKSLPEIAFKVIQPYVSDELDDDTLNEILEDVFTFDIPLIELEHPYYSLELFHGPTCAFKDVGARFLARCLSYFTSKSEEKITILVATSGDTGSAVAHGFYNVPNVDVKVLFPKNKISHLQKQQMTTLGGNIEAFAIEGTFDNCQKLVKKAFLDEELRAKVNITSANSINIARLLPQMIYYFYAWTQVKEEYRNDVVFAVPSGNYGNLTAGLIAQLMGLPVKRFIAASNANNIVPKYLNEGAYKTKISVETLSNAMDVGNPSNFARMLDLHPSHAEMIHHISGYYYTDEETQSAILEAWDKYKYITDPHGAIGFAALNEYGLKSEEVGIFLHTAHPAKFEDVVKGTIQTEVPFPDQLKGALNKESIFTDLSSDYPSFRNILLS